MQIPSDKIQFLVGDYEGLASAETQPALPMFSKSAIDFLSSLSRELLHDSRTREMVDVVSYAYWIRKASLNEVANRHADRDRRLGRGIAFHIAPSNVPVNFAVSMTSSLLAGNITVVRVSNKAFEQVDVICDAANRLLNGVHSDMKPYLYIVRYDHDAAITGALSSICDIRVIWGGDKSINDIRNSKLPTRAIELTFADRHSLAIIDADEYLQQDQADIAKRFFTDTYYTDQNACSSPRLICWMGKSIEEARNRFWKALRERISNEYDMQPIQAVDKFDAFCALSMGRTGVKLVDNDNVMMRVEVDTLSDDLMDYKQSGGYFFEYNAESLEELIPILGKRCQTISVLGIDRREIMDLVFTSGVRGVDRIVPLGETMGLEFIWDGYRMIEAMTRLVYMNY